MIEIKVNSKFKNRLPIAILDHYNKTRLGDYYQNSVVSYLQWIDKDKKHLKTLIWYEV